MEARVLSRLNNKPLPPQINVCVQVQQTRNFFDGTRTGGDVKFRSSFVIKSVDVVHDLVATRYYNFETKKKIIARNG